MQCLYCDVFLLHDKQCRFFLWHDHELCQFAKLMMNNLIKENKHLQEEIKNMKQCWHQFSFVKIICIDVFFAGNCFLCYSCI